MNSFCGQNPIIHWESEISSEGERFPHSDFAMGSSWSWIYHIMFENDFCVEWYFIHHYTINNRAFVACKMALK